MRLVYRGGHSILAATVYIYIYTYSCHGWMVTVFDTYLQDTVFKPRYHHAWKDLGQVTHG